MNDVAKAGATEILHSAEHAYDLAHDAADQVHVMFDQRIDAIEEFENRIRGQPKIGGGRKAVYDRSDHIASSRANRKLEQLMKNDPKSMARFTKISLLAYLSLWRELLLFLLYHGSILWIFRYYSCRRVKDRTGTRDAEAIPGGNFVGTTYSYYDC